MCLPRHPAVAYVHLVRPMAKHPDRHFSNNDEFYTFVDTIAQRLCASGLAADGDRLNALVHKVAWTTSTELFGELRIALRKIDDHGRSVDAALLSDIAVAIEAIDYALCARARSRVCSRVPPRQP